MNDFSIHLKDEKFDQSYSREMQLLIKITPKRISYAIVGHKDHKLLILHDAPVGESTEEAFTELFDEHEFLRLPYARIKVSVQTLNFTFIPIQYYTRDDLPSYEKIVQSHEETKTFVSTINGESVNCVIALELKTIAPCISAFSQ